MVGDATRVKGVLARNVLCSVKPSRVPEDPRRAAVLDHAADGEQVGVRQGRRSLDRRRAVGAGAPGAYTVRQAAVQRIAAQMVYSYGSPRWNKRGPRG